MCRDELVLNHLGGFFLWLIPYPLGILMSWHGWWGLFIMAKSRMNFVSWFTMILKCCILWLLLLMRTCVSPHFSRVCLLRNYKVWEIWVCALRIHACCSLYHLHFKVILALLQHGCYRHFLCRIMYLEIVHVADSS